MGKIKFLTMVFALSVGVYDAASGSELARVGQNAISAPKTNSRILLSPSPVQLFHSLSGPNSTSFGNVTIGTGVHRPYDYLRYFATKRKITFGTVYLTGSPDFSIDEEEISGFVINDEFDFPVYNYLRIKYSFWPTSEGFKRAVVHFPYESCASDGLGGGGCFSAEGTIELVGEGEALTPDENCERCGSLIQVDDQSVIETIPIVGSDITLNYVSANMPEFISPYSAGILTFFNEAILSVSNVHYYNVLSSRIHLGTGKSRLVRANLNPAGEFFVASSDGVEVFMFDSSGKHLRTLYGLTGQTKTTFSYDASSRLTGVTDAFGNTTSFVRDGSGALTQIISPFGLVTTISLNASGYISAVEDPKGQKYELSYKSGTHLLEIFKKPGGQISTLSYDSDGKLLKDQGNAGDYYELSRTVSGGVSTVSVASKMGRVATVEMSISPYGGTYTRTETLPSGAIKQYIQYPSSKSSTSTYMGGAESAGLSEDERLGSTYSRISKMHKGAGPLIRLTDIAQNVSYATGITPGPFNFDTLTKTTTVAGGSSTSVFSASTSSWLNTSHEGATSTKQIDSYERPVQFTLGSDTPWTLSYDTSGRISERAQGTHKKQTITYDSSGFVQKIKNARNEEIQYSRDLSGRITQVTLPDLRVISYSYDANGNVTGITPPGRPQHVFGFNAAELMSIYQPPSIGVGVVKDTNYTYNDDKQLTNVTRPDGTTIDYTYDATGGQLTSITVPTGTYVLGYQTNGLLAGIKSPDGLRNSYTYTGNLKTSDSQIRAGDSHLFGKVSFTYNNYHQRTSRTIQGNLSSPTSTINTTYNNDEKPVTVGDLTLAYGYPSGRLSTTTIDGISDSRTYDAYGDLVSYSAIFTPTAGPVVNLYSYTLTRDIDGRISSKTETIQGVTTTYDYTYDSAGRLTLEKKNSVNNTSFNYDSNSNRTSGVIDGSPFSATYDDQDRLATFGSRTYTYNRNGDLTHIQWTVTQGSDFVYDAMGNLKQVTLPTGAVITYPSDGQDRRAVKMLSGAFQFRYIYEDQYRIATILNGADVYGKEFVYATKVNVPDYMIFSGVKYRIITDHLGSPRLVVRTDNGAISQRIDYNVIGEIKSDTNPGFQPFAFAGGLYDNHTQLVRFGVRDYDPRATGRWTTRDPILFNGGDANLYGYVLSDPINFIDPSGTTWAGIGGGAVGGALGGVIGACALAFVAGTPIGQAGLLGFAIWGGLGGAMIGNYMSGGF